MREADLILKQIIFRRPCTEPIQMLLREVADFLDTAPDIEDVIDEVFIQPYVSEPTAESYPDCLQMREARLFVGISSAFNNTKIGELG
jgi:hypothetical protein